MNDFHKQAFIEEAMELLSELEISLLELEKKPDDKEIIAKVFRALHTVKGSSGMFGYDDITMFTHDIETVYHLIRNSEIKLTKEIIDITLSAKDQIKLMLGNNDSVQCNDEFVTRELLSSFRTIVNEYNSGRKQTAASININTRKEEPPVKDIKCYIIKFDPSEDIFLSGTNPVMLLNEVRELGCSIIKANIAGIPPWNSMNPEKCYINWEILLRTGKGIDAVKDIFIFIEDQCDLKITEADSIGVQWDEHMLVQFESFLSKSKLGLKESLNVFIKEMQKDEKLQKPKVGTLKKAKETHEAHHETETTSSIRVSSEKLDLLVNLVGELVTLQARLSQVAQSSQDPDMLSISEEAERITWSLRDSTLNIRMLTIGSTFSKFNRLVRDLSKELGKEVELTTEGAETELDKTVIEKLNDPLVHIIRNCIDHGIESPEVRLKAGKPRIGKVHLSATHSGGNVIIKISDDGAGLNKNAILEKARSSGLLQAGAELTDSEIYSLIFGAGFSTAKVVTNVSGRGVGMDVVRRAVETIRGTIEVASKEGAGTTITLKLPLTLAIIDGLLVAIGDEHYVLPLSSIEECIELTQSDIENFHGRNIVNVRGGIVPFINLRERFRIGGMHPPIEQIVIADINGGRIGFVVDKVLGQHQTVLKNLGNMFKNVECVSGSTILGDGTVALIFDINKIMDCEEAIKV